MPSPYELPKKKKINAFELADKIGRKAAASAANSSPQEVFPKMQTGMDAAFEKAKKKKNANQYPG